MSLSGDAADGEDLALLVGALGAHFLLALQVVLVHLVRLVGGNVLLVGSGGDVAGSVEAAVVGASE